MIGELIAREITTYLPEAGQSIKDVPIKLELGNRRVLDYSIIADSVRGRVKNSVIGELRQSDDLDAVIVVVLSQVTITATDLSVNVGMRWGVRHGYLVKLTQTEGGEIERQMIAQL
jgi:hypothetical protein